MIGYVALAAIPWVLVAAMIVFWVREPRLLPSEPIPAGAHGLPLPSVRMVVPARNEARNIERCLRSLAAQAYSDFAITVVDDGSADRTGEIARSVPSGGANEIRVLSGAPLPTGWFGKPWACSQGSANVEESLILFTDADTVHAPSLLRSAVLALMEDSASALSLIGHQELGTFGERLVQPQVFTLLGLRYRRLDRPLERNDARNAIANGQYILVRRSAYEGIGGHRAVRGEVAEDLRLGQLIVEGGHRLSLRTEPRRLSTRMYQSLSEVVAGWTKNIAIGAKQSAGWWGPLAIPSILVYAFLFWVIPPLVLLWSVVTGLAGGGLGGPLLAWSFVASLLGLGTWAIVYRRFQVSPAYAFMYPLGAAFVGAIALRSGWRGSRRVEWKGRRYSSGEVVDDSV